MQAIHHRYADIDGRQLFYREAGAAGAPARRLVPRLRPGVPARQRPGPAGPVRRLRHQPPAVPQAARLPARSRVPLLAVWGRNDEIFGPEGALAFAADAPGAEICLLDGGHFLLESHLDIAAAAIGRFLDRTLS